MNEGMYDGNRTNHLHNNQTIESYAARGYRIKINKEEIETNNNEESGIVDGIGSIE
jgi:hypothetical protein